MFDGHGGGEVAKYTKKHYEALLKAVEEYKEGNNLCEAMRKSFLQVDVALNNGGLEEVAQFKRENPPTKSPLMKILTDVTSKKKAAMNSANGEPDGSDDEL